MGIAEPRFAEANSDPLIKEIQSLRTTATAYS